MSNKNSSHLIEKISVTDEVERAYEMFPIPNTPYVVHLSEKPFIETISERKLENEEL